jgi:hypothetical protein
VLDPTLAHESAAAVPANAVRLTMAAALVASTLLPCELQDVGPDENAASVILASEAEMEPPADASRPVSA